MRSALFAVGCIGVLICLGGTSVRSEPFKLDSASQEQAELEKKQLAEGAKHSLTGAIADYRKTAEKIEYPSGDLKLPGWLYRPAGDGPFPAVIWNHGSEKMPTGQPELARFYTAHGFVFFIPVREGHGTAAGEYIVDLQTQISANVKGADALPQIVELHDRFNRDVVAAVAWLKTQPFVDRDRIIMSGCSYGGIQTLLSAEKGLGVRGFVPFAPAAMSWANPALRQRLETAAKNAKAPVLLIQAENDFSTGPSETLGPLLDKLGAPSGHKLFAPFGSTHEEGHAAFACWSLGTTIWGDDVLDFIEAALKGGTSHAVLQNH